jgi:hypothetical protein
MQEFHKPPLARRGLLDKGQVAYRFSRYCKFLHTRGSCMIMTDGVY